MFTKQIITLFVTLVLSVLAFAFSPSAAPVSVSVRAAHVSGLVPPAATDSLSTITKFHSALKARDTAAVLPLLANDIVVLEIKPAGCRSEMVQGIQAVAKTLAYSQVLSFSVENVRAQGNAVTYAVTEWLDPRTVGPNYPQPVRSNVTARVESGQIVSITTTRDAAWVNAYKHGAQEVQCW